MAIQVTGIVNRARMDVHIAGPAPANRLLIYTGTAVLEEILVVGGATANEPVDIFLGDANIVSPTFGDNFGGPLLTDIEVAPHVTLAAIVDLGDSSKLHWTVDSTTVKKVFPAGGTDPMFLVVQADVSMRGDGLGIMRLGYRVDVLAAAREAPSSPTILVKKPNFPEKPERPK